MLKKIYSDRSSCYLSCISNSSGILRANLSRSEEDISDLYKSKVSNDKNRACTWSDVAGHVSRCASARETTRKKISRAKRLGGTDLHVFSLEGRERKGERRIASYPEGGGPRKKGGRNERGKRERRPRKERTSNGCTSPWLLITETICTVRSGGAINFRNGVVPGGSFLIVTDYH